MIPIRLELKNFMSYGEDVPVLDFSGMHTLCLSGENGHGKSALLDALTWSLWGESRAGKNKHDDLVRIGADEMSVHFTFEMDGLRFRVFRKRSKKTGGNIWELHQETEDLGLGAGWRALTGNNAGETEKAIQKLLRMSYDTFLNSAYLRQGQADQFVRQTPGKRKEILADILDLSRYDQLEAKARERAKAAQADATDLERDISGIDAELRDEAGLRLHLGELEARLQELHGLKEKLAEEFDVLRERIGLLKSKKELAATLQQQENTLRKQMTEDAAEISDQQLEAKQWRALLDRRDEICRDYDALLLARREMERLEQDLARWNKGKHLLAETRTAWLTEQSKVQRELDRAVTALEDAQRRTQDYALLKQDHDRLAPRIAGAEAQVADREAILLDLERQRLLYGELETENARLNEQVRQWDERLAALSQQKGFCLVCNAPLTPGKIAESAADYTAQRERSFTLRAEVRAQGAAVKKEINDLETRWKSLEKSIKDAQADRDRFVLVKQHLFELEEIQKDLPTLAAVRDQLAAKLEEGRFATELSDKIADYEARLAKLGNVEADYEAAKLNVARLAEVERLHNDLAHSQKSLAAAEARIARAEEFRRRHEESLADVMEQLAALTGIEDEIARVTAQGQENRHKDKLREDEERVVHQDSGKCKQQLARLEELKVIRADKAKRLTDATYDAEVHEQLTRAFGKKGVQALIIENAIPELQEEANRLLDRLTDGDMSLYFDTLRESRSNKKEGPIETLDIKVSDNLGTRPLEMYSGGEGFRAAFALRIALSKLLTRRAGARLQTLIIDEGFGSQDAKGREKLVECLNAIKDDFERIIVITHIDELKDAFATRVEVIKTPAGSQITVMEGSAG